MHNPPAYVKTPAKDLGPPIVPHRCVALGPRPMRVSVARIVWVVSC